MVSNFISWMILSVIYSMITCMRYDIQDSKGNKKKRSASASVVLISVGTGIAAQAENTEQYEFGPLYSIHFK